MIAKIFILNLLLYLDWKISALSSSHLFFFKSPHLFTLVSLHILLNLFIPQSRFLSIFQYLHFSISPTFHLSFTPFASPPSPNLHIPPFHVSISSSLHLNIFPSLNLQLSVPSYLLPYTSNVPPFFHSFVSLTLHP
jgi:hypothetical protein